MSGRADRSDVEVVRLDVPADTEQLRLVRLVVVGMATACGADLDDLEDLRIATGELCTAMVATGGAGDRLLVEVTADRSDADDAVVLRLALAVPGATGTRVPAELDELSSMVLATTTDRFGLGASDSPAFDVTVEGEAARAWLERRLPAAEAAVGTERSGDG